MSCFGNTFNEDKGIDRLGPPIRLEYYRHYEDRAFQWQETPVFIITDSLEMATAINEIKNANSPQPKKGAGWDRLIIRYPDTVLKINTSKTEIGLSANGQFYSLGSDNFITRRMSKE